MTLMIRLDPVAIALSLGMSLAPLARPAIVAGQENTQPPWQRDRGPGVAASMFGTYIRPRELVVYPFFEYTHDANREYQPEEFGLGPDVDFGDGFGAHRGSSSSGTASTTGSRWSWKARTSPPG